MGELNRRAMLKVSLISGSAGLSLFAKPKTSMSRSDENESDGEFGSVSTLGADGEGLFFGYVPFTQVCPIPPVLRPLQGDLARDTDTDVFRGDSQVLMPRLGHYGLGIESAKHRLVPNGPRGARRPRAIARASRLSAARPCRSSCWPRSRQVRHLLPRIPSKPRQTLISASKMPGRNLHYCIEREDHTSGLERPCGSGVVYADKPRT